MLPNIISLCVFTISMARPSVRIPSTTTCTLLQFIQWKLIKYLLLECGKNKNDLQKEAGNWSTL